MSTKVRQPQALSQRQFNPQDNIYVLQAAIVGHAPILKIILTARDPVTDLNGDSVELLKVRNAVAHGDEKELANLTRLKVDALRRHLTLVEHDGKTILQYVLEL